MIKAFFVRILRAASTVGGAVANAVTLNKTWVLCVVVDDPEGPHKYMFDRYEQNTWITSVRAKQKPVLGKSEIGVFQWVRVKSIKPDDASALVENEEGGMKSRKFDSIKDVFTKAEFLAAVVTKANRRG